MQTGNARFGRGLFARSFVRRNRRQSCDWHFILFQDNFVARLRQLQQMRELRAVHINGLRHTIHFTPTCLKC